MEDLIDEEIEHGPVIDDVEDTEDYQETMEVIEEETVELYVECIITVFHFADDSPLKDTCDD
ncbi:hypothetical protein LXL04_024767 [Taraxacum kok-saghyz]